MIFLDGFTKYSNYICIQMIFERKPCFLDPLNKKLHDLTDINIHIRFKFLIFQRIFNLTVAVKNISVFQNMQVQNLYLYYHMFITNVLV